MTEPANDIINDPRVLAMAERVLFVLNNVTNQLVIDGQGKTDTLHQWRRDALLGAGYKLTDPPAKPPAPNLPTCFLCKKPIKGRVYYQGGSTAHLAHKGCRVSIGGPHP